MFFFAGSVLRWWPSGNRVQRPRGPAGLDVRAATDQRRGLRRTGNVL